MLIFLENYTLLSNSREGVKLIPGGRFGMGRIVMTKTIYPDTFNYFFDELIDWLRFPGKLSVDAHGFIEAKNGDAVFVFGSENSSIELWNKKQSVVLKRKEYKILS